MGGYVCRSCGFSWERNTFGGIPSPRRCQDCQTPPKRRPPRPANRYAEVHDLTLTQVLDHVTRTLEDVKAEAAHRAALLWAMHADVLAAAGKHPWFL